MRGQLSTRTGSLLIRYILYTITSDISILLLVTHILLLVTHVLLLVTHVLLLVTHVLLLVTPEKIYIKIITVILCFTVTFIKDFLVFHLDLPPVRVRVPGEPGSSVP